MLDDDSLLIIQIQSTCQLHFLKCHCLYLILFLFFPKYIISLSGLHSYYIFCALGKGIGLFHLVVKYIR